MVHHSVGGGLLLGVINFSELERLEPCAKSGRELNLLMLDFQLATLATQPSYRQYFLLFYFIMSCKPPVV